MAANSSTSTAKLITNASGNFATFEGAQELYINSDADVFIDFDQPAVTTRSLLIKANLNPARFELKGANIKKVYAITSTGTANVWILAVYN